MKKTSYTKENAFTWPSGFGSEERSAGGKTNCRFDSCKNQVNLNTRVSPFSTAVCSLAQRERYHIWEIKGFALVLLCLATGCRIEIPASSGLKA